MEAYAVAHAEQPPTARLARLLRRPPARPLREEEREERETKRSEDEKEEGRERVGSEADKWDPHGPYYF